MPKAKSSVSRRTHAKASSLHKKRKQAFRKGMISKNTNMSYATDRDRKALPPGKRISKDGNIYWESRANRADFRKGMSKPRFAGGGKMSYEEAKKIPKQGAKYASIDNLRAWSAEIIAKRHALRPNAVYNWMKKHNISSRKIYILDNIKYSNELLDDILNDKYDATKKNIEGTQKERGGYTGINWIITGKHTI